MRRIILQDAAVLLTLEEYKSHKTFQNPFFYSSEFLSYQNRLLQECQTAKTPENLELERVVPVISEQLAEMRGDSISLKGQISQMDKKFDRKFNSFTVEVKSALDKVSVGQQISFGQLFSRLGSEMQSASESPSQTTKKLSTNTHIQDTCTNQDNYVEQSRGNLVGLDNSNYEMDRNISSVRSAWLEYTTIIAPLLKKKWIKNGTETRFYDRRRPLFEAMLQLIDGNFKL
jgi:hypothetical protein